MSERVVAPTLLHLYGSIVDWRTVARTWYDLHPDPQLLKEMEAIAQSKAAATYQLRWVSNVAVGLSRKPVTVYVRAGGVALSDLGLTGAVVDPFPIRFDLAQAMAIVDVDLTVNAGATVLVLAYSGTGTLTAFQSSAGTGAQTIRVRGSAIDYILVRGSGNVTAARGITAQAFATLADWKAVEIVGLPCDATSFAGTSYDTGPQGLSAAPVAPVAAALRRLNVGQPLLGWMPVTDTGALAPPWRPPAFAPFIDELRTSVLQRTIPMLRAGTDSLLDSSFVVTENIPPPAQQGGATSSVSNSQATVPSLGFLLIAGSTDPFNALGLGFGTAYTADEVPIGDQPAGVPVGQLPLDFMVVAQYTLFGAPLELADFVIGMRAGTAPRAPALVTTTIDHQNRPLAADAPYTAALRTSWLRPMPGVDTLPRAASYALSRTVQPNNPVCLLTKRASGGFIPFAPTREPNADENAPIIFVDGNAPPPHTAPNTYTYAVADQDAFGRYSPWQSATIGYPPEPLVVAALTTADLVATYAGSNVCAAKLTLDITWDWSDRSPAQIDILGVLLKAADLTTPYPPQAVPSGMQYSLTALPAAPVSIVFDAAGNPSTATPGAAVTTVSGIPAVEPAQDVRVYRLTLGGFALDFTGAAEIALFLWASGSETIAPSTPTLSSQRIARASNPVPPPPVPGDALNWASLPDHVGISRAHLAWNGSAPSYVVYEATETALRNSASLATPNSEEPYLSRLATLRALDLGVNRQAFRRVTQSPITQTELEIALPRGSGAIHAFVVTAVNANNLESAWPSSGYDFIPFATPHVVVPRAPRIPLASLPGVAIDRFELYRTSRENLATDVDLMGPPLSVSNGAGWRVVANADGTETASYVDTALVPSWSRVWYRGVAWSADDLTAGARGGRSLSSNAFAIVLPPTAPPAVQNLLVRLAGSTGSAILIGFQIDAPIARSALGDFVLTLTVLDPAAADARSATTFRAYLPLRSLIGATTLASGPGTGSPAGTAFYLRGSGPPTQYYAWLTRPARASSATTPFRISVALRDPLWRGAQSSSEVSWV